MNHQTLGLIVNTHEQLRLIRNLTRFLKDDYFNKRLSALGPHSQESIDKLIDLLKEIKEIR